MNDYFHKNHQGKLALNSTTPFDKVSVTDVTYGSYILNCMLQDSFLKLMEKWNITWTDTVPHKGDKVFLSFGQQWILTGSMSENLNVPFYVKKSSDNTEEFIKKNSYMADYDVLLNCAALPVIAEDDICFNGERLGTIKFLPDTHAGYLLIEIQPGNPQWDKHATEFQGKHYLDGEKFISSVLNQCLKDHEMQGPAIVGKREGTKLRDNVICFPCSTWPNIAEGFLQRKRPLGWPSDATLQTIINEGCHIVKVAHKKSVHQNLEFRFSFSVAETILAKELTISQRRVYIILKILHNLFIKEVEGISSYHIKTVLFWALEEHKGSDVWKSCNTVLALNLLLDKLAQFIKQRNLPNYFIPENNMFDSISESDLTRTSQIICKIRNNHVALLLEFLQNHHFLLIHGQYINAPPQEEVKIWASMNYRQVNDDIEILSTNLHRCSLHLALAWLVEIATVMRAQQLNKLEGVSQNVFGCVIEAVRWAFEIKYIVKVDSSNKQGFIQFFLDDFSDTVKQFSGSQKEASGKVTVLDVFNLVVEYGKKNQFSN